MRWSGWRKGFDDELSVADNEHSVVGTVRSDMATGG
jgi:hypothetical protein